jgi:hypothetical protein
VGSLAQDALKKKDKHKDEHSQPYYGDSQYGGSQHSGNSSKMDSLGSFFKK